MKVMMIADVPNAKATRVISTFPFRLCLILNINGSVLRGSPGARSEAYSRPDLHFCGLKRLSFAKRGMLPRRASADQILPSNNPRTPRSVFTL